MSCNFEMFPEGTSSITAAQFENAFTNLYNNSQSFRAMVDYVNFMGGSVAIRTFDLAGEVNPALGGPVVKRGSDPLMDPNYKDYDYVIEIPLNYIDGDTFGIDSDRDGVPDGASIQSTFESVIAHEIWHIVQDMKDGPKNSANNDFRETEAVGAEDLVLYEAYGRGQLDSNGVPVARGSYDNPIQLLDSSVQIIDDSSGGDPVSCVDLRDTETELEGVPDQVGEGKSNGSPLILDLNDSGTIDLISLANSDVYWDIDQDGFRELLGWVDSADGMLAIDLNANGEIDDNGELFGTISTDGFSILSDYDSNDDGVIDSSDAQFESLLIWQDSNENGYSSSGELSSLSDWDIVSIDLNATEVSQTNQGHDVTHTSTYVVDDGVNPSDIRIIHDVWFEYDNFYSIYNEDYRLDLNSVMLSVNQRGYGVVPDLLMSMSLDNDRQDSDSLVSLVAGFKDHDFSSIFDDTSDVMDEVRDIMFRWAGVDDVDSDSRGSNVDARELEFLEAFVGEPFVQSAGGGMSNPGYWAGVDLDEAFDIAQQAIYARLVAQSSGGELFTGDWYYDISSDNLVGVTGLDSTKLSSLQTEATSATNKDVFWMNVVRMIEMTIGVDALPGGDQTALDSAITASDATLDLQDILDALAYNPANEGSDYNGTSGADTITGSALNDTIDAGYGDDTLNGSTGNDDIDAGDGNDEITGGGGNDYLKGFTGNDNYYYDLTDGDDVIKEHGSGTGNDDDRIVFGSGIDSGDLTITRAGDGTGLLIEIDTGSQTGQIFVENQFKSTGGKVELIEFDDTSTYSLVNQNYSFYGTAGNDTINGVQWGGLYEDVLYGLAGNDTIDGKDGDDIIYGGDGNDHIKGGDDDDIIYGDAGDDIMEGGSGNDTLYDGAGGNDVFDGGLGDDDYYYTDGHDVIQGSDGGTNTIYADSAFAPADATYIQSGNDMIIQFDDDNSITIIGHFSGGYEVDTIEYSDTTSVDLTTVSVETAGDSGNNTISGDGSDNIIYGMGGDDTLDGNSGDDVLYGGTGDDALDGGNDDDILRPEAGDDDAEGGAGNDLYYYHSGNDVYYEAGGTDILVMPSWVSGLGDMTFTRDWAGDDRDIIITFNAANTITLDDAMGGTGSSHNFETLRLASGDIAFNTISVTTIGTASADTIGGTTQTPSDDDIIYGYGGADIIDGDSGDDTIYGGDGADDLDGGVGDDTLYGEADADTIFGDSGADVIYGGAGNDDVDGGNDNDIIYGDAGDDILDGSSGDDILYGGAGDDELYGGGGDDLLVYDGGLDEVYGEGSSGDVLWISGGVVIDEISIADEGSNDARITINSSVDEIYVDNMRASTGGTRINFIKFDDGFITEDVKNYGDWLWGTSGNDMVADNSGDNVLIGGDGDDTLDADSGDDDLHGGSGDDELYGDAGDDFLHGGIDDDDLYGGAGTDTLYGGAGSDSFIFESGLVSEVDSIEDFSLAQGDSIDISDVISSYDPMSDDITEWVQITDNGTDSTLYVDTNGGGDSFTAIATIVGVTGLTDEADLETNGYLIAA